jgi:S-DNA-T family DNA segregation ATPase FtsK/SpoIIIE
MDPAELVADLKDLFIHSPFADKIRAAIHDVIQAHYKNYDLKPLILKWEKSKDKKQYTFVINLPPYLSYKEFLQKEVYFAEQTGGAVFMERKGKTVTMKILTEELRPIYHFSLDPEKDNYSSYDLPLILGQSAAGLVVVDLAEMPHLLIAGNTGNGKSNFIHCLLANLLLLRDVRPVIIDLKRVEFSYLKKMGLAMVAAEPKDALKVLLAINKEMDRRLKLLEDAGVQKVQDYPQEMAFILLVIDELNELQDKESQKALNRLLRLGRSTGICICCATQRPSATLCQNFSDSKALFGGTVCFRVRDSVNSQIVLDNDKAAYLPDIKGRAIFQGKKEIEIQTFYLPVKKAKKLLKEIDLKEGVFDFGESFKRLPPR